MEPIPGLPGRAGEVRKNKKTKKNCGTFKLLNYDKVYKPLQGNVVKLRPASEDN